MQSNELGVRQNNPPVVAASTERRKMYRYLDEGRKYNPGHIDALRLAENITLRNGYSWRTVKAILDEFMIEVMQSVRDGQTVKLRGFGKFESRYRPNRKVINPQTGGQMENGVETCSGFCAGCQIQEGAQQLAIQNC